MEIPEGKTGKEILEESRKRADRRFIIIACIVVVVGLIIARLLIPLKHDYKITYTGEKLTSDYTQNPEVTLEIDLTYKDYILKGDTDDTYSGTMTVSPFGSVSSKDIRFYDEHVLFLNMRESWWHCPIGRTSPIFFNSTGSDMYHLNVFFTKDFSFVVVANPMTGNIYLFHDDSRLFSSEEAALFTFVYHNLCHSSYNGEYVFRKTIDDPFQKYIDGSLE